VLLGASCADLLNPGDVRMRRLRLAVTVLCVTSLVTACGGSSGKPRARSGSHQHQGSPVHSATRAPTATHASSGWSYTGNAALTDAQNYTWNVDVTATLGRAAVTTTGEQPGFVTVAAPVTGGGDLTNTTPGYTATSLPAYLVAAIYPRSATICASNDPTGSPEPVYSAHLVDIQEISELFGTGEASCAVVVAEYFASNPCPDSPNAAGLPSVSSLAPQQETPLTAIPDGSQQPCLTDDGDPGHLVLQDVPAADGPAVAASLNSKPTDWALLTLEDDNGQCPQAERVLPTGEIVNPVVSSQSGVLNGCTIGLSLGG
jgi:hypothetical protein